MVAVFADQNVRQQTRAGLAALDRQRRHVALRHALAAPAGERRAHMPDHLEVAGDVIETRSRPRSPCASRGRRPGRRSSAHAPRRAPEDAPAMLGGRTSGAAAMTAARASSPPRLAQRSPRMRPAASPFPAPWRTVMPRSRRSRGSDCLPPCVDRQARCAT